MVRTEASLWFGDPLIGLSLIYINIALDWGIIVEDYTLFYPCNLDIQNKLYLWDLNSIAMGKIKNIVFDLGGVIIDLDRDEPVRRLIEIGVKDADGLIDPYEQKGVFQDLETGKIGVEEFCRYLRKYTGKDLSYEDICWAWFGFIGGVPQYKLDYILKLREKYQVYTPLRLCT